MPIVSQDLFRYFKPEVSSPPGVVQMQAPGAVSVPTGGIQSLREVTERPIADMRQMGKMASAYYANLEKARIDKDARKYAGEASIELDELQKDIQISGKVPHKQWNDEFIKAAEDIRKRKKEAIGDDPDVLNLFEQNFDNYVRQYAGALRDESFKRELNDIRSDILFDGKQRTLTELANSNNPQSFITGLKNYSVYLQNQVALGTILDSEAKTLFENVTKEGAFLRVKEDIRVDPEIALAQLQSDKWNQYYPGLDAQNRYQLINEAESEKAALKRAWEADQKQKEAAQKKVAEIQEELLKDDFLRRIETGQPTSALDILDSALPVKDKEHYIKMLEDKAKSIASDKEDLWKKSDPEYFSRQLMDAMDGKLDPKNITPIKGKLSISDAKLLKEEAKKAISATGDTEAQQYQEMKRIAINDGRRQILSGSELLGYTTESVNRANRFQQNLLKALDREKDVDKRISMLTMGSPDYIVDKLIIPNMQTIQQQIEAIQGKYQPGASSADLLIENESERQLRNQGIKVTVQSLEAAKTLIKINQPVTKANVIEVVKQLQQVK